MHQLPSFLLMCVVEMKVYTALSYFAVSQLPVLLPTAVWNAKLLFVHISDDDVTAVEVSGRVARVPDVVTPLQVKLKVA